MKWSELKKQGINRCSGIFTNGKRCGKRTHNNEIGFCTKHKAQIELMENHGKMT